MKEQSTDLALAKLMAGCDLSTSAACSRDPVADSGAAASSSSSSAASAHAQQNKTVCERGSTVQILPNVAIVQHAREDLRTGPIKRVEHRNNGR